MVLSLFVLWNIYHVIKVSVSTHWHAAPYVPSVRCPEFCILFLCSACLAQSLQLNCVLQLGQHLLLHPALEGFKSSSIH